MSESTTWYIVKIANSTCQIVTQEALATTTEPEFIERWGPYPSQAEAIAKRVGLIRAGKCQPV
jgi:hypothetical protein